MTLGALAAALTVVWVILGAVLWRLAARVEVADRAVGPGSGRRGAWG